MKKYLILSSLFLLAAIPIFAKGSTKIQAQPGKQDTSKSQPIVTNTANNQDSSPKSVVVTPTGEQTKNQNEIQTKNQGEDQQLSVKNQESEQLNQVVDESLVKVSDQVQKLVETVGAKSGIGTEVKEIAQGQTKIQDQIKTDIDQLNSRGTLSKFFIGSDKKLIKSMEKKMEQNRLMIQQLEELKVQTKNSGDIQQFQETIDLMTYQDTSLQNKIDKENKSNGMFGWLINLFLS
jgi:hypothetical protein